MINLFHCDMTVCFLQRNNGADDEVPQLSSTVIPHLNQALNYTWYKHLSYPTLKFCQPLSCTLLHLTPLLLHFPSLHYYCLDTLSLYITLSNKYFLENVIHLLSARHTLGPPWYSAINSKLQKGQVKLHIFYPERDMFPILLIGIVVILIIVNIGDSCALALVVIAVVPSHIIVDSSETRGFCLFAPPCNIPIANKVSEQIYLHSVGLWHWNKFPNIFVATCPDPFVKRSSGSA